MVKLYKRGKVWWVQTYLRGFSERRSLRTRSRGTAEALVQAIELDVLSGGRLRQRTWKEFATEFEQTVSGEVRPSTLRWYLCSLDNLSRFLEKRGVMFVCDVTPAVVTEFIEARRQQLHPSWKRVMTQGGVRAYLRVLHRIFALAVDREYLQRNPVTAPNRNAVAGRTQPFSPEEITKMLTAPYLADKAYLRAIALLFLHSGLRIGDVIELKKADVDGAYLNICARKNSRVVRLPVHAELREALNVHQARQSAEQKTSPYLFATETGAPIVGLDKHLRRLWKACGVAGGHAHRFRDTFAVRLLEQGASLYDVAKLLGISAVVVEAHYAPYVKELQERGRRLVSMLNYTTAEVPDSISSPLEHGEQVNAKVWRN
jgi:integrase